VHKAHHHDKVADHGGEFRGRHFSDRQLQLSNKENTVAQKISFAARFTQKWAISPTPNFVFLEENFPTS